MISPASDTSISSTMLTGYIENATAILPLSTSCSSVCVPFAPPTKSMRGRCAHPECRESVSATAPAARCRPACRARLFPEHPRSRDRPCTTAPSTYIETSPFSDGVGGPGFHGKHAGDLAEEMLRRHPVQIADNAVVGKNAQLIRRKRHRKKEVRLVRIRTASRARAPLAAR